jgi:hypothetical protein
MYRFERREGSLSEIKLNKQYLFLWLVYLFTRSYTSSTPFLLHLGAVHFLERLSLTRFHLPRVFFHSPLIPSAHFFFPRPSPLPSPSPTRRPVLPPQLSFSSAFSPTRADAVLPRKLRKRNYYNGTRAVYSRKSRLSSVLAIIR